MKEEDEYSILEKKFREWFGKTVPAAIPVPDEADRSIRNPVSAALPLRAKPYHLNPGLRRKQVDNSPNILTFLSSGLMGAGYFGALVGFIFIILNISHVAWYPAHWPSQFLVIFFVMVIGFNIGLANGYVSQRGQR